MLAIRFVTREEITERVKKIVERERLTYKEFIEQGEADELEDWELRDLWRLYHDAIIR